MKHVRNFAIPACLAVVALTGCAQIEQAWGDLYYEKEPGQAGTTAGQKQAQTTEQKQPQTQKQQAQKKLTPQQEAKATLERVFACEQNMRKAEALKLVKLLGGKILKPTRKLDPSEAPPSHYTLPKQAALNIHGQIVEHVDISESEVWTAFEMIPEDFNALFNAFPYKVEVKRTEWGGTIRTKRTKHGIVLESLDESGGDWWDTVICNYNY
jgi:hypothetical protein